MPSHALNIAKHVDRKIVDGFVALANGQIRFQQVTYKMPGIGITVNNVTDAGWKDDAFLNKVLEKGSALISSVVMQLKGSVNVTFERNETLFDKITITYPDQQQDPEGRLNLFLQVKALFEEIPPNRLTLDGLDEQTKQYIEAREQNQNRMQQRQDEFFAKMEAFTLKQTEEYQRQLQELDKRHAERTVQLDAQYAAKEQGLTDRENQLKAQVQQLNLKESRGERRRLGGDLKQELKETLSAFDLSKETRDKRMPIFYLTLAVIVGCAAVAGYLMFSQTVYDAEHGINWILVARQFMFSGLTIAFISFLIKWANSWAQRHADEEFRLRRMSLDSVRASWVVEVAMEWKKENDTDIPPEFFKQLAKNLYLSEQHVENDMTPADHVATALFGAASHIKLKTLDGQAEVELDRKGKQQLDKVAK